MKIAVCIKQVVTGDVQLRLNETKTWIRDQDATFEMNEPDAYAPDWGSLTGVPVYGDTFDASRIMEYLWVMAVGSLEQRFEWQEGEIVEVIERRHDYRSSYLCSQSIVDPPPPAGPVANKYLDGVAYGLNCSQDPSWIQRSHAQLEYLYTPPFFRHVYGGRGMERWEYLSTNHPEPAFTPNYQNEARIINRGEGYRADSARDGYGAVLDDMGRLLGDLQGMPSPMSQASLAGVQDSLWPGGGGAMWMPK